MKNHRSISVLFEVAIRPIQQFLRLEAASGILLLLSTFGALLWANLHLESYENVFSYPLSLGAGPLTARFNVREAINDGLMTLFFFVVGMEIKRELVAGELNSIAKACLPAIAAVGGMAIPAGIFLVFTSGGPASIGWGIPMATDIAFCVGILALLRDYVPRSLVVFVIALAIFDDIGGILVIALFYGSGADFTYLGIACVLSWVLIVLGRSRVSNGFAYGMFGIALWYSLHHGGVHSTIAGVIVGFAIPAGNLRTPREVLLALSSHVSTLLHTTPDEDIDRAQVLGIEHQLEDLETPVERFIHLWHPFVAFIVMPMFAVANSGISLRDIGLSSLTTPAALGVIAGLVIGKPLGIFTFTLLVVWLRLAPMPFGARSGQLFAVSVLAGVGFTVALFIAALAYSNSPILLNEAKLGILVASCVAGLAAFVLFCFARCPVARNDMLLKNWANQNENLLQLKKPQHDEIPPARRGG